VTERSHLSIGEVLNLLQDEFPDITISKIRFLESQGLLDPERTPSGYRKFYEGDIERLRWILRQQKENFLPLKVIKDRLASGELDDPVEVPVGAASSAAAPAPAAPPVRAPASMASRDAVGVGEVDGPPAVRPTPAATSGSGRGRARADQGRGSRAPAPPSVVPSFDQDSPSLLDNGQTGVSLTVEEILAATGLTAKDLSELEGFGLIESRTLGNTSYYDDDALVVAKLASGFMAHGVEARHLRMYKVSAEREAGVFEQLVMPLLKQRNPGARVQATERLDELATLGGRLRGAMLRQALREHLGGG
jgi:DNA-binding transcriptional MerR regulator